MKVLIKGCIYYILKSSLVKKKKKENLKYSKDWRI